MMLKKLSGVLLISSLLIILSGCSSDPKYKGVYEKNEDTGSLEVPPDMTFPSTSRSFDVPTIASDQDTYSVYAAQDDKSVVLPQAGKSVRFVREGELKWLEIDSKPDEIWSDAIAFFKDVGFSFTRQEPLLGILETNWLENRVDVPTGWFASLLGALYSAGKMDRYRIRFERKQDAPDTTLVFISHQGLKESSYGDYSETDVTVTWEPRDSDPELEIEMMMRFLIFKGMKEVYAKRLVSKNKAGSRAIFNSTNKNINLVVKENFARTWRRMGVAMDRLGIQVEDRNRSEGTFYIKLTEDFVQKEDKSWLAKLFSSEEEIKADQYRLSVEDLGESCLVTVQDKKGSRINNQTAILILKQLQQHLK